MTTPVIHINKLCDRECPPDTHLREAAIEALGAPPPERKDPGDGPDVSDAEISVTLVAAPTMRDLNRRFHGVDAPTDVLAFSLARDPILADVYVCPAVAEEQAGRLGVECGEEIIRLVVHGVLHLIGYDHPSGEERTSSPMFRLQERLVSGLSARLKF